MAIAHTHHATDDLSGQSASLCPACSHFMDEPRRRQRLTGTNMSSLPPDVSLSTTPWLALVQKARNQLEDAGHERLQPPKSFSSVDRLTTAEQRAV